MIFCVEDLVFMPEVTAINLCFSLWWNPRMFSFRRCSEGFTRNSCLFIPPIPIYWLYNHPFRCIVHCRINSGLGYLTKIGLNVLGFLYGSCSILKTYQEEKRIVKFNRFQTFISMLSFWKKFLMMSQKSKSFNLSVISEVPLTTCMLLFKMRYILKTFIMSLGLIYCTVLHFLSYSIQRHYHN